MNVGFALPHYDFSIPGQSVVDPAVTIEWAEHAEALGFDSVWVSDHFFIDLSRYGGPPGRQGSLEPLAMLAAIATSTERVRMGTLVLCEAFRPAALVASSAATIDRLSGGRLEIGMGAGWNEEEFIDAGLEFPPAGERMSRLERAVRIVAGNGTPVFIGSKGGPRSLRIVAEAADGWNTVWRWPLDQYEKCARALDEQCERAGRDPKTVSRSIGLYAIVGTDAERAAAWKAFEGWMPGPVASTTLEDFARGTMVGTPEECAERCAGYAAFGVEELIVSPAPLPFAIPVPEQVEIIAEHLIPLVRDV